MSKNAAIMLITSLGRVLMVKETRSNKWMPPGGQVEKGESTVAAAYREFREETGFEIVSKFITAEKSYIIRHKSRDETEIFVIHTSQRFPRYTKTRVLNRETCDLHYFKVAEFKKLVAFRSPIFKRYVINSAAQLIAAGAL